MSLAGCAYLMRDLWLCTNPSYARCYFLDCQEHHYSEVVLCLLGRNSNNIMLHPALQALLAFVWVFNIAAVIVWMPWLYRWQYQPSKG